MHFLDSMGLLGSYARHCYALPSEDDEPRRMFNFLAWAPRVYAPQASSSWLMPMKQGEAKPLPEPSSPHVTNPAKRARKVSELVRVCHACSVWVDLSSLDYAAFHGSCWVKAWRRPALCLLGSSSLANTAIVPLQFSSWAPSGDQASLITMLNHLGLHQSQQPP